MTTRRNFIKNAGFAGAATLAAPSIARAQEAIKWRFQTYAGSALGEHVTKPVIDYINTAANGELQVELFYADQIVPTGELFKPCSVALLTVCTLTMTQWHPPRLCSNLVGIFRLQRNTSLMCLCCSISMV